ncbi:MAG: adenylate/guanylate cyclase domain-containing protein [Magnetovibrio sp.]|nr:adenylate/guanylate cyclase domain-containing protein [Magnetovibrio sp.]
MALQTNYEVHVQQGGRWSIHAQFDSHQKDTAIEEAKQLDSQGNIGAVKVIREVYDTTEGTHRDYVVYKSAGVSASDGETDRTGDRGGGDGGGGSSWMDDDGDDGGSGGGLGGDDDDFELAPVKKGKGKKPSTLTGLIVKVLLIMLFSICLAVMTVVMASYLLSGSRVFGIPTENILLILFVVFLLSSVTMGMTFMRGERLDDNKGRRPRRARAAPKAAKPKAAPAKKAKKKKKSRDDLDRAMAGSGSFKLAEEEKDAAAAAANERLQKELHGEQGEGEDAQGRGVVLDADAVAPGEAGVETLSPHAEKQKAYMMDFLSESLSKTGADNKKMDNFNKFGVNLFLAGACETLAEKRDLDGRSRSKVLADSVRVMGFKKSHAATFADKYEEYLLQDPRYMQMYQAGRNAMNTHFQDPDESAKHLQAAMGEWNQPKKKEAQSGPITVLFTDIAGSTAMTQKLGDAGAQEVVRAHNRIVRAALTDNNGREVKHTGDGIMASFSLVTDSVDAAIQMQRETIAYTQANPDLPLHLKIGINSGEPIVEDNDLFGTVVQLSARIVDKAQADEIYVSEIVRGICTGKNYTFESKGGYDMKGFDGQMQLFEVIWRDAGAAAAE